MSAILEHLRAVASQPIEAMTDADELRDALATADDIANRLRDTLHASGAWWTPTG